MSNPYFQFKQFTVWHDKCAMKVGTDGVLLGAWTSVETARRILDIGTGTGLVALMIAQRSPEYSKIIALEIDTTAAAQAMENVLHSSWKDRIEVIQSDFMNYQSEEKFDVIVSNPPYFIDSLECPENRRNTARHNNSLNYQSLLTGVSELLSDNGIFTIVIPTDVCEQVKQIAYENKLYAIRQLFVSTKPNTEPKRTLISFAFQEQKYQPERLLIETSRHQYSKEYINLTKEYYLKM